MTPTLLTKDVVLETLRGIPIPGLRVDAVTAGIITGVIVKGDKVGFAIEADALNAETALLLQARYETALKALPGTGSVTIAITAQRPLGDGYTPAMPARATPQPPPALPQTAPPPSAMAERGKVQMNHTPVPGIAHIIAVASGKGGVGKSTTAVNLAAAIRQMNRRVGLLDADIYGPSIPLMMGIHEKPETANGLLVPPERHGIPCMSMGFLVEADQPSILRGPMISKTLSQFVRSVAWGELDILLVDMPPGTGDIHLSLAQQVPLDGAVIVSTPQDVAWADAIKCVRMFERLDVPILGVVENMSYYKDPDSGTTTPIFGYTKPQRTVYEVLGEVPLIHGIREGAEAGVPAALDPASGAYALYRAIAAQILDKLHERV